MAFKGYLLQNDDGTYTIDTRVMMAEVDVAGGITKGLCCHITGESIIPKINIASIDDINSLPIFGMVIEDGDNGDEVKVVSNGLVTGIIDTSSWALGDTLYLAVDGVIDNTPPTGFGRIVQMGTVANVGVLDGSVQLGLQYFVCLDEDDLVSDSNVALATQQSIKAYGSHDRQLVVDQTAHTTSSSTFEDLPNATFTAKDLNQISNYLGSFSILISPDTANTTVSFRITINGSPVGIEREVLLRTNNADVGFTFLGDFTGVVEGDVIQAQWKTDKGVATMSEFNFVIDGIPEARIVT